MAIRDEQGLERHVFEQTGAAVGTSYNGAHGLDTSKVVRINGFAKDTVNGYYVENHNPNNGHVNMSSTSNFNAYLDSTNWNMVTTAGATNLVGATLRLIVYTKP